MSTATNVRPAEAVQLRSPSWEMVVRAQLRATGLALRTDLILGALLLAGTAVLLESSVFRGEGMDVDLVNIAVQLSVLALFFPMTVWKGDEPSRRQYHWAMPVPRGRHSLTKVLAGWTWFFGLGGAYVLASLGVALATGGDVITGTGWERDLAERVGAGFDRQSLSFHGHAWLWLVPFGAMTASYLLGSVVALSMNHPWRFMAGLILVVVTLFAATMGGALQDGLVASTRDFFLVGRYGILTLFSGLPDRSPDAAVWCIAVAMWSAVGLVGVLTAAGRRRDA